MRGGRPPGLDGRWGALARGTAPVLVGIVAFALARSTLLPGQGLWDTGEFQVVAPVLGTAHPTGYPSYVLLGWLASSVLAPLGEPAFRLNLLNAVTLGVAAGLTVLLVRRLTGRTLVGVAAGLLLALTPIPWRVGSFADPHMLHLVFVAGLLLVLVGWEERARDRQRGRGSLARGRRGALWGRAGQPGAHRPARPGIALFILAVEPGTWRRPALVARVPWPSLRIAALLYLELPIRAAMGAPLVYGHPDTWGGFWYVVLGLQFGGALGGLLTDLAGKAGALVALATAQFGPLVALIPASLLVTAVRRPRYALLTTTWLVMTGWFAVSYTNADIERYYLGPILIVVSWLAIAADGLVEALEAWLVVQPNAGRRVGEARRLLAAVVVCGTLVAPAVLAAPTTRLVVDLSTDTSATGWSRWALPGRRAERGPRDLVGLLHAALVSPADPGRASRRQRRRRPDPAGREPGQRRRRDPREPGPAAGLPRAARRGRARPRGQLAARRGARSRVARSRSSTWWGSVRPASPGLR